MSGDRPDVSHAVGDARKRLMAADPELPNHDEVHGHADGWPYRDMGWEGDDS
jgi:hypothetical protein